MIRFLSAALLVGALAGSLATAAQAEPQHIAIANFGPHESLDWVVDGFKKEMAAKGFRDGQEVVYDYSHGNFNPALLPQILTQLEAKNPVLMLTVTTPVAQAAKTLVKNPNLPIVFASVTDPVKSQLVPDWEHGSARQVGSSNLQDMNVLLAFVRKLLPKAKVFGLPYNPGESNDLANMEAAKIAAAEMGFEFKTVGVESVGDIAQRIASLKGADFIYVLPSNLLMPAAPAIASAADRLNIPLISSSPPIVQQGVALATMSVSWEDVGARAGDLAAQILRGKKPSELANYRPTAADHVPMISAKRMAQAGITLPDSLKDCKCVVP